jgi:hypothetical protein
MNVVFKEISTKTNNRVICDSNVWYYLANGTFETPEDKSLIATSLSIMELASSETLTTNILKFKQIINAISKYSGPIIPLNPFDYILVKHDPKFPIDKEPLKNTLVAFSEIKIREIPETMQLEKETVDDIKIECRKTREATVNFSKFATESLVQIRKNINKGNGKKNHVEIDTRELIKEMLISIFKDYSKSKDYTIYLTNFKWDDIDFFIKVTENYFKKLEITKNMKVAPNDAVDWLNMIYVMPDDHYLTFEKSWKNLILSDSSTKSYLFEVS